MSDLILSKLKDNGNDISKGEVGKWTNKENKAFKNVADSLDYTVGEQKNISSVPTMWARPLIVEMALYDSNHPIHKSTVSQWRGMLAAIALAEVEGFDLKVQLLDLGKDQYLNFAKALKELTPESANLLYTREGKNPWQEIYVFLWKGKPVGMTSPTTLVCPSEEGNWEGLRWWNQKENLILSPEEYLNQDSKNLLWRWLENIQQNLVKYNGKTEAINKIITLLSEFRTALKVDPNQTSPLILSQNPTFFGESINRGALELLNNPVQVPPKPSNLRVIPSAIKSDGKPLIIIDDQIAEYWGTPKQNIWVHQDKTLASLNIEDLRKGVIVWDDIKWVTSQDLFLEELYFLDLEDGLPGGLLPKSKIPFTFNGEKITPLLPLNPILLDYFTPEDLISKIEMEFVNNINGQNIRLTLNIPLSGVDNQKKEQIYRIQKDYRLKEENGFKYLPVLTVWPKFRAKNWKQYYTFYYDGDYGDGTFKVYFQNQKIRTFKAPDGTGSYQLSTLDKMPTHVVCKDKNYQDIGLILLATPPEINSKGVWRVGVDFGTSFSNVYVKGDNSDDFPLEMNKDLQLNITESPIATRFPALIESFIPHQFLPSDSPLPLCTVITTKNANTNDEEDLELILDGRIYVPDPSEFDPNKQWIKLDLKWSNLKYAKAFLRHLSLHISALATQAGMDKIEWCVSYPSAFSYINKTTFHRNWEDISEELTPKTGINYSCPKIDDNQRFCTESVALAQYFNDKEKHPLLRTTCIDIGGGTSDISIWENRRIVYQCSVLFAGRNIFSEILAMNTVYAENLMKEFLAGNWASSTELSIMTKIDIALRHKAEEWLNKKRINKNEDQYFQRLITLTALGIAGLYYYVGLILKTLHEENKYTQAQITPVYIGGNASRFLHWLSPTGRYDQNTDFNKLLSLMLSKASGFKDTQEKTRLSIRPKHEVACGLVLSKTELTGITENTALNPIAGENYYIEYHDDDDNEFKENQDWRSPFHLEGNITKLEIAKLDNLEQFLYEFHQGLKTSNIQSIQPLAKSDSKLQQPIDDQEEVDKNTELWKEVRYHLDNELLDIKGDAKTIREKTPFIMGLKSLLHVLGKRWADSYKP